MFIKSRSIKTAGVEEVYLLVSSDKKPSVKQTLEEQKLQLIQGRDFGSGIFLHAVGGATIYEEMKLENGGVGRLVGTKDRKLLALSGISTPEAGCPKAQAQKMFEKTAAILKTYGLDFSSVARTWLWLDHILDWYADFNQVRNSFFTTQGLIGKGLAPRMPASTGIGFKTNDKKACALDLVAIIEPKDSIEYFAKGGKQNSALNYGSAFSRATKTKTLAGTTVFISGTAAIDAEGKTLYVGDAAKQIDATITNIRADLAEMNCQDQDVANAIVYCKDKKVEQLFLEQYKDLSWNYITVIADICRPDLLFEIEVTVLQS